MVKRDIFRKTAIELLSSPDRLNQLMVIVSPRSWLMLAAFCIVYVWAVVWSLYGRIPVEVVGQGILISRGGLITVNSQASGAISSVFFNEQGSVEAGDTLMSLEQPELLEQVRATRLAIQDLEDKIRHQSETGAMDWGLQLKAFAVQEEGLKDNIADLESQKTWLIERIRLAEPLVKQGVMSYQEVFSLHQQKDGILADMNGKRAQLSKLAVQKEQVQSQNKEKMLDITKLLDEEKGKLKGLQSRYDTETAIIAPCSGQVVSLDVKDGDVVQAGAPLATIERTGVAESMIEAVLFYPPEAGKRIKPGDTLFIAPDSIKEERYGALLGLVTQVSSYPATLKQMTAVLQNDKLAQSLSENGAPILVEGALVPCPNTFSRYLWTSSQGPPVHVTPGVSCKARVAISREAPINLIITGIKERLLD